MWAACDSDTVYALSEPTGSDRRYWLDEIIPLYERVRRLGISVANFTLHMCCHVLNRAVLNPARISVYNLLAICLCFAYFLANRILRPVGFRMLRCRLETVSPGFFRPIYEEVCNGGCVCGL